MKYFIGIVPPPTVYEAVLQIQKPYGDNRLEPHITLRPPITLTNEFEWLNAIENVCRSFPPIHISLPSTGNFGSGVLFIDVRSTSLENLHHTIVKAIKPFEIIDNPRQKNQVYHPHLTLARAWCGFSREAFAAMNELATFYLAKEPVSFVATEVRIYSKPTGKSRYEALKDLSLSIG